METRIKELRKAAGLTQEQLAEKLDTTKSMVSMLEDGKRRLNSTWIKKLSEIFGVSHAEIFSSEFAYKNSILTEKISLLEPKAQEKVEELVDLLLPQHKRSTE